jgi:pimeloyl-ACP methyl ester carboxylesterase
MKGLAVIAFTLLAMPAIAQESPFDSRGPYEVKQSMGGPGCHFFRPVMAEPHPSPVILWGNATNTMVVRYAPMLAQWASHGFIVGASVSGNAGSGQELLACLDFLEKENAREGSVFNGAVDPSRVGASGHSQGATGAIMAGRDPRIRTIAPIQPATRGGRYAVGAEKKLHGPMLLLSGGADNVTEPGIHHKPVFESATVPVVWATLLAAGHNTPVVQDSGPYRSAATAWFLWQLIGDEGAGSQFKGAACGYCVNPAWVLEMRGVE